MLAYSISVSRPRFPVCASGVYTITSISTGGAGMKIVSWNVNGLARCRRNGFLKFLADAKPDVLCCQEIKGECPLNVPGYLLFWNPAKRTNYSGTLVLSRRQPLSCQYGLGIDKFDEEGRLITLEYKDWKSC